MAIITLELFDHFTLSDRPPEHICMVVSSTEAILFEKIKKDEWILSNVLLPSQGKFVLTNLIPNEIKLSLAAARFAINLYRDSKEQSTSTLEM